MRKRNIIYMSKTYKTQYKLIRNSQYNINLILKFYQFLKIGIRGYKWYT